MLKTNLQDHVLLVYIFYSVHLSSIKDSIFCSLNYLLISILYHFNQLILPKKLTILPNFDDVCRCLIIVIFYGFIIKGYTICPLNPELNTNVFIKVITISCRHLSNIMTHVKLDANIIGVNIQKVY